MFSSLSRHAAIGALCALILCGVGFSQAGVVVNLGPGCGDPQPNLTVVAPPVIGGTVTFVMTGAAPDALVFVGISDVITPPFPFFGPCPIYVDLATLLLMPVGTTSATGDLTVSFPIPLNPLYIGVSKNVQFLIEGILEGKSLSVGLNLTIGVPQTGCTLNQASIGSNFNGTSIAAGNTIWFNAIVDASGIPASGGIVRFDASTIDFTAASTPYVVNVPPNVIVYDPAATTAETHFDAGAGEWRTTVPASYSGNVFLSGVGYPVNPALPGGINPVNWTGTFSTNVPGVSFQWKWAAAVYTAFSTDLNAVGAKPVDGSSLSIYANSDHAGTPEGFKAFVTGGARGGGGSNFTGSYSGTSTAACQ